MNPQDTLKHLGLTPKEAALYVALLELGETSILVLSQKAGIKRPTCYVLLKSLEEKGFVSRALKGKKTLFVPQHPRKLLIESELRMKELQEVMPQLESLLHGQDGRPRIMIYEGKEALDRAYDESFLVKDELVYMGTLALSSQALPRTYRKLDYATFSPAFRIRELIDESEEAFAYAHRVRKPYREVRFIPKERLPFEVDIGIFGNRTLITSVKKEYFTICIESDEVARAFRVIFDVMWSMSKE